MVAYEVIYEVVVLALRNFVVSLRGWRFKLNDIGLQPRGNSAKMIEHIHFHSFMRLKKKEGFTAKNVQRIVSLIGEIPTLNKVKQVLCKHDVKSCLDAQVGVADGLTLKEIQSLEQLVTQLDLLEDALEKHFEADRSISRKDKRKSSEMNSLVLALVDENLPLRLIEILGRVCFESRKRIVQIFSILIQKGDSEMAEVMEFYFMRNAKSLIGLLTFGFQCDGIALHCGDMLRKCFKHDFLVAQCLSEDFCFFNQFFNCYLQSETFDSVSDAFLTVRTLFSSHKAYVALFLETFGKKFARLFNEKLLCSKQYLTQRNGLELLHDILFERQNYRFMVEYVNSKANLVLIMQKMLDTSHAVRFNALHIFKIFVANPNKTEDVSRILGLNRERLVLFLQRFDVKDLSDDDRSELLQSLNAEKKLVPIAITHNAAVLEVNPTPLS